MLGNLPGVSQTIVRAELFAWIVVLYFVEDGPVQIVTDSEANVRVFHQFCIGTEKLEVEIANVDLWSVFLGLARRRSVLPRCTWVKSHITGAGVSEADSRKLVAKHPDLAVEDIVGNAAADALADLAAQEVQVSKVEAANFLAQVSVAKKVQRRALVVLRVVGSRKARVEKE